MALNSKDSIIDYFKIDSEDFFSSFKELGSFVSDLSFSPKENLVKFVFDKTLSKKKISSEIPDDLVLSGPSSSAIMEVVKKKADFIESESENPATFILTKSDKETLIKCFKEKKLFVLGLGNKDNPVSFHDFLSESTAKVRLKMGKKYFYPPKDAEKDCVIIKFAKEENDDWYRVEYTVQNSEFTISQTFFVYGF